MAEIVGKTLSALKHAAVSVTSSGSGGVPAEAAQLAAQLRTDSIRCTDAAHSGHATSSLSAADLMSVLCLKYLRWDARNPHSLLNDRLIFSKGHACPLLYSIFKSAGAISEEDLLSLRKLGKLEGHPNPRTCKFLDVATGSLGQGAAMGVGMALAAKLHHLPTRTFVLLGDSECAEGSVWEAFDKAAHYKLDNLTAIIDVNRLGQTGETAWGWDLSVYASRARAFGWHAIEVDGHNLADIDRAFYEAVSVSGQPTVIVAKTIKGKGVPEVEDKNGWHGKALDADVATRALASLGGVSNRVFKFPSPPTSMPGVPVPPSRIGVGLPSAPAALAAGGAGGPAREEEATQAFGRLAKRDIADMPSYALGSKVATRKAYGAALTALGGTYKEVVALDAEVSNSTGAETFKKAHGDRFFEMYIAEQCMIGAAVGLSVSGTLPFCSTFGAFISRAYDFIRMAAISDSQMCLVGSHAGVAIGEDGPSQMALEDIAMMRSVYGSTVLHPCDANQTVQLMAAMATEASGIRYLRTLRGDTPVIYPASQKFPIGGSVVIKRSDSDVACIIAAGVTVHEALAAADQLKRERNINVRVVDCYSIKPLDVITVVESVGACGGKLVVVEDHWPEGGLGDACTSALASRGQRVQMVHLAVDKMVGSGTPEELLQAAGIDHGSIVRAVSRMCA